MLKYRAFVFLLFLSLAFPARTADDSTYIRLYGQLMRSGQYEKAMENALSFRKTAYSLSSESRKMLADSYVAQVFLAMDIYDSAKVYLDNAKALWDGMDSALREDMAYSAFLTVCNGLGIYYVTDKRDYEKAITCFYKGQQLAQVMEDYSNYAILGSNMVVTYFMRKDTSGLKYAQEIYRYGYELHNEYVRFTGSYVTALMYFLKGDMVNAGLYIEETMQDVDNLFDRMGVYRLYADILSMKGDVFKAEKYYKLALSCLDENSVTSAIAVYLSYGQFLVRENRNDEAAFYLQKGITLAESRNNRIYTYNLYELATQVWEELGDSDKALEMYRKFYTEISDINAIEQERAINNLMRKYEDEKHARELQLKELTIMKKNRELQLVLFIGIVVFAEAGVILIMYRNKNRMYTRIVRQYKEAIGREKMLRQQKYSKSSLTEDNGSELFARFIKLVDEHKVYHEKNLTRDRLAEMLDTNRTYLSRVVNEKTGMSILAYLNSRRIDEALEILSDAQNDIPLKAFVSDIGFSSITTFYKLFQEKVGMPPAKYRERIKYLSKTAIADVDK